MAEENSDWGYDRIVGALANLGYEVRHQVHPILSSDHRVRSGRAAGTACAKSEPECLFGTMGQIGEGRVFVKGDPLWRALPAAGAVSMSSITMLNGIIRGSAISCCSLGIGLATARGLCNAASDWVGFCVITIKRRREAAEAPFFGLRYLGHMIKEGSILCRCSSAAVRHAPAGRRRRGTGRGTPSVPHIPRVSTGDRYDAACLSAAGSRSLCGGHDQIRPPAARSSDGSRFRRPGASDAYLPQDHGRHAGRLPRCLRVAKRQHDLVGMAAFGSRFGLM